MSRAPRAAKSSLFSRIGRWFGKTRRRPTVYRRPSLERLEDRLAPATLHQAGTVLTITLDNVQEALALVSHGTDYPVTSTSNFVNDGTVPAANFTGFDTTSGDVTAAGLAAYTEIDIGDAAGNTSVAFNDSGANAYTTGIKINLTNALAGGITFTGTTTFSQAALSAVTPGAITSAAGSTVQMTTSGSLTLQSTNAGVTLAGTLANPGSGTTAVTGTAVQLGAATSTTQALTVTATNGAITQTGPVTATAAATFAATSGAITLTDPGNTFGGPVALSATQANNVTVFSNAGIILGNITLGTGTFSLTARGAISQLSQATGGIQTQGAVKLTITKTTGSVTLDRAPNSIGGTVTVAQSSAGKVINLSLRNDFENALPPVITGLGLNNYSLRLTNAGINLLALTLTGNLTLTAGGPITESAAVSAVNGSFTVVGNYGIKLDTFANSFTGTVAFSNPSADAGTASAVAFSNSVDTTLGHSTLGLGSFSVTSATGDITQAAGTTIVQGLGAGPATFTATGGVNVLLGDAGNDFSGPVRINGANVTTVNLDNADPLATIPTLPASVTDLTLTFEAAPVVLPSFTGFALAKLTVMGNGIFQQTGSSLAVSTLASFTANAFPLQVGNAGNNFNQIALSNSGPDDVSVQTTGALVLTSVNVGNGQLTVSAGGAITETSGITQATGAAGATFSTGAFAVTLDQANTFTGPVSASNSGANGITINNAAALVLGTSSAGAGFTVTTTSGNITQAAGAALTSGAAASSFTAAGDADLGNAINNLGGAVSISANNATLQNDAALSLGTITVTGTLTVSINPSASSASISQTGPIRAPTASFRVGVGGSAGSGITLGNAANNFGTVSFAGGTGQNVTVTNTGALVLGTVTLGGGTLTVSAGGDITQASGTSITGIGALMLNPSGNNVTLDSAGNSFGTVTVSATNVTLTTTGDLTFAPTSSMTGNVTLTAGGKLTLPTAPLNVVSFTASANSTTVGQSITTTGNGIAFTGAVTFTTAVTLDTTASGFGTISFTGDVMAQGPLTLNLPDFLGDGAVTVATGTWNQGANGLTINGASDGFTIGTGSDRTTFVMSGGVLSLTGQGNVTVDVGSTFEVSGPGSVATIANGAGTVMFSAGARLLVGLAGTTAANDELVKQGTGTVNVTGAILSGTGLAAPTATPVLSAGGQIVGFFAGTVNPSLGNSPRAFLMGTDIVLATYAGSTVSVKQGGTVSATGTVAGFQGDGDRYKVTASGGATAGLVVITDSTGRIDIVLRNGTAAQTLTITTTPNAGTGITTVGGIALDGSGPATIIAPTTSLSGDITVAGPLASLTVGNMSTDAIDAGGTPGQSTAITGGDFDQVAIALGTVLKSLTVTAFTDSSNSGASSITAAGFGTIQVTGNAAAGLRGDFAANLRNTAGTPVALTRATIAHQLSGTWDLAGSVGAVSAGLTSNWQLGVPNGPGEQNGGALGAVGSLNLGVVTGSSVTSGAGVGPLTAVSWTGGTLQARSFGNVTMTGRAALGDNGNFTANLTATGNDGSAKLLGLGVFAVAGGLTNSNLVIAFGNVAGITVGGAVTGSSISATPPPGAVGVGAIGQITAAQWLTTNVDAGQLGVMKVIGNAHADLEANVQSSTLAFHLAGRNPLLTGPASFAAGGLLIGDTFTFDNESLASFTVGRILQSTNITVASSQAAVGTVTVGAWTSSNLTAASIGAIKVLGAPQTAPASVALLGTVSGSTIDAFAPAGSTPAIGTFSAAGPMTSCVIDANGNMTALQVVRAVSTDTILVPGRLGSFSAGQWNNTSVEVGSLGSVAVTGYATPELSTGHAPGDIVTSNLVVNTAAPTGALVGVGTFTVAGSITVNSTVYVPFGITTLTVAGAVSGSQVTVDNPLKPTAGQVGTLSAGGWSNSGFRAGTVGTFKTTGNAALNLAGDVTSTPITLTVPARSAAVTISVAGGLNTDTVDIPGGVGSLAVRHAVQGGSLAAGFATGGIKTMTIGSWSQTNLTTQAVGSWSVLGNRGLAQPGNVSGSVITVLGSTKGVGLGTFLAAGTVSGSTFDIAAGNVGSFTVGRFLSSDLLVGFRFPNPIDLLATATPAKNAWAANDSIGVFQTTAAFAGSDPASTAAFQDSNVVAAVLGKIILTGVNPTIAAGSETVTFGIGFRSNGGAAGTALIDGKPVTAGAGASNGAFRYQGLLG